MNREQFQLLLVCVSFVILSELCRTANSEAAFDKILRVNERVARLRGKFLPLDDGRLPERVMGHIGQRGAPIRDRTGLWPNGVIPYLISFDLQKRENHIKVLKNAMQEWENKTCIRFKKRRNEADYVLFYYGDGCNSDVGRVTGKQSTSLGQGCADHGIVVHEIGHLVGFWHEQNRPDRDKYIEIKTNNILKKFRFAFQKYSEYKIDSLGVEYDYESVMHYGAKAFSRNRLDTIVSKNRSITKFGNNHLSPLDVIQANRLYECSDRKKVEKRNPKFPEDFMWRYDGPSSLYDCIKIYEPREMDFSWTDNYFCTRKGTKPLGLRWSHQGALSNMNCVQITEPEKPTSFYWKNNYLCAPKNSPLIFKWSNDGRIPGMKCIEWREPADYFFKNNYLCAEPSIEVLKVDGGWSEWSMWRCSVKCGGGTQTRTRTCTNPAPRNGGRDCIGSDQQTSSCNTQECPSWPAWPDDFSFVQFDTSNKQCVRIYERTDYQIVLERKSFCANKTHRRDLEMEWFDQNISEKKKKRRKCLLINEPRERTWQDNYLCMNKDAPYRFRWSFNGRIPGFKCLRWVHKNGRNGWDNNYLCSLPYRSGPKIILNKLTGSSSHWGEWSKWSECSLDCGGGEQKRTRSCIKDSGLPCQGSGIEERFCNVKECRPCGDHFWKSNGRFSTPGYPNKYPKKASCVWTISASIEKRIRMRFNQFDLPGDGVNCHSDYVVIRDGSTSSSPLLGKYCGRRVPPLINSRTSSLWVNVKTTRSRTHKGFEAEWTTFLPAPTPTPIRDCGGLLTSNSGRFTSPNFPNAYPPGRTCIWTIEVDPRMTVNLVFRSFNLEPHARCGYDHVAIRDGATEQSPTLGIYCGNNAPPKMESFGNSFWIKFRSDASTAGRGFEAYYMAKPVKQIREDTKAVKACPKGWIEHNEGNEAFCYVIRSEYKNWYDAQKDCKVMGSNLLSLSSKNEQSFVVNELIADTYLWLGLTDKAREGVWAWSDKGKKIRYENWAGGDPNDGGYYGNEDCAVMKPDGKWNDYPCNQRFKYICKKEALSERKEDHIKGLTQSKGKE